MYNQPPLIAPLQQRYNKADNHKETNLPCVLSALRLCVWRFDNGYIKLFNINQTLALTFWTKKRKVFENGIFSDFVACFITTNRTTDKICFFHAYHFTFRSLSFFFFSSRYFRMILFLTGIPTPISKTTAKIVKSIPFTSHFFVLHNPNRKQDRYRIHNYDKHNHKYNKQHRRVTKRSDN